MLVDCPESGGTVFTVKLPINDKSSEAKNETG